MHRQAIQKAVFQPRRTSCCKFCILARSCSQDGGNLVHKPIAETNWSARTWQQTSFGALFMIIARPKESFAQLISWPKCRLICSTLLFQCLLQPLTLRKGEQRHELRMGMQQNAGFSKQNFGKMNISIMQIWQCY